MGKRRIPTLQELCCPTCGAVDWKRVGERVVEDRSGPTAAPTARHLHANEDGPWDWTCQACGHVVRPASSLDHMLAKVQPSGGIRARALIALAGLQSRLSDATPGQLATAAAGTVAVGAAAVAIAVSAPRPAAAPPAPPVSPSASVVETPARTPAPSETQAPTPAPTTLLEALVGPDAADLTGRLVTLDAAPVHSVTGDVTFWVGPSEDLRVLVVVDEREQPEKAVTVRDGQRVRVRATVVRAPVEGVRLSPADREAVADDPVYLRADRVRVLGP